MAGILSSIWGAGGRAIGSIAAPIAKGYILKNYPNGIPYKNKLWKNHFHAFYASFKVIKENINGNYADILETAIDLEKSFKTFITDTSHFYLISKLILYSETSYDNFMANLRTENLNFIKKLAENLLKDQDLQVRLKDTLDNHAEEECQNVMVSIFTNYYPSYLSILSNEELSTETIQVIKNLESIISDSDENFQEYNKLEILSEKNIIDSDIIETALNNSHIFLSDVYVQRDIEEDLLTKVSTEEAQLFIVKGEAV